MRHALARWLPLLGPLAVAVLLAGSSLAPVRAFGSVDFYDYYFAAEAIAAGLDPYDGAAGTAHARAAAVPAIDGSDFIYPAWFAVALVPLTLLPPRTAAHVWTVATLIGLCVIAHLLARSPRPVPTWLVLLFPPTLFSLFVGQVNPLLLLLLVSTWFLREKAPVRAGLALGLACAIKLMPLLLVGAVLAHRRWRLAATSVATFGACLLVGELAAPGSTLRFFGEVLPTLATLDDRHAHPVNQGLGAFLLRSLAPNPWTQPWWPAPHWVAPLAGATTAALFAVTGVGVYRAAVRGRGEGAAWAALLVCAVVTAPVAWESTFVLLLLPMGLLARGGRWSAWAAWVLIAAQRALDSFSSAPTAHALLQQWPPLSSLALWGGLLLWWRSAADLFELGTTPVATADNRASAAAASDG